MGDWEFASESDSVTVGRQQPGARDDEDATAGVARRLQARLDRHLWWLDQHGDPGRPDGSAEELAAARRMRHDTESLLLLCGADPNARAEGPRPLADVLAAAAAAAEEPHRVEVRRGRTISVAPTAAVELEHVLAELVDHTAAVHPGALVALAGRVEIDRAVLVELLVVGASRHDPGAPGAYRAAATAERLAWRSRGGLALQWGSSPPGVGPAATVVCPAAVVTVEEAPPLEPSWAGEPPPRPRSNGNGVPHATREVDELFGPLGDLPPLEPMDDRFATPIFEAIASAWFVADPPGGAGDEGSGNGHADSGPLDWDSPSDREWQAAASQAARPVAGPLTASGLPRRRPGDQLVPPSRAQAGPPGNAPADRVPDRVRERLSTYQRGLRQGRHRAADSDAW